MTKKQKKMLIRICIAIVLLLIAKFVPMPGAVRIVLFAVTYLVIGYDILKKAAKGIGNGRVFDENFLMAIATLGAIALAVYEKDTDLTEAVAVMLFYQIGELFQSYAVGKSRRNITALMDIRPDYANIETDGKLEQVDPDTVAVGSVIVVQPGEKVPIDGVVVEGTASLNTSALTGESLPREIIPGEEVISGCIDMSGVLKIRTTKNFGESTVSKILELVEESSSRKSRSEAFISKFARVYTPAVCCSALALAVLPPVINLIAGNPAAWAIWIYRALTFLVISCPCALVVSIPLSFFAGIGGASKAGVLIKGSNYMETLSQTKIVVFDKTGTLTKGVFEVSGIHHNELENEKLIELAAHAECASSHPISKSLQRAYGKPIDRSRVSDIEEISGHGLTATVDGMKIAIGNDKLMEKLGVDCIPCHCVGTILHIAIDGKYAGHIVISDIEKPDAKEAIVAIKRTGAQKTVMLTGDTKRVAEQVAKNLGVDEVHSELLPADKVTQVEKLLAEKSPKAKLAFVGDGINDAGPLAGGHRHRDGRDGLRRGDRSGGRRADGRRPDEDLQGHRHLPQVHPHRVREHRVRAGRQGSLSDPRRVRHRGYVAGHLRRRRRHDPRRPQCHPRAGCEERLTSSHRNWEGLHPSQFFYMKRLDSFQDACYHILKEAFVEG